MPSGHGIWIQAGALPTTGGGVGTALGINAEAKPVFVDAEEALRCGQEVVAVLQRHGIGAELHDDSGAQLAKGGESTVRGIAIWINAEARANIAEPSGVTLSFQVDALPAFADAEQARRCGQEIIAVLKRYGIKAQLQ